MSKVDPPSTDAPCGFIYNIPGRKKHFSCDARRQLEPATKTDRPAGAHTDDSWAHLANHTLGTGTTANQGQGKQRRSASSLSPRPLMFCFVFFFGYNERRGRHLLSPPLRPPPFFSCISTHQRGKYLLVCGPSSDCFVCLTDAFPIVCGLEARCRATVPVLTIFGPALTNKRRSADKEA